MPELCGIQCRGASSNGWGAIAYSKKAKISGWSYELGDKATAEKVAVQYCAKQGGGTCQVAASFNHTCGAIAVDGEIVSWGTSGTKVSAQERAMAECGRAGGKKCGMEASVCSAPNGSGGPSNRPTPGAPPAQRSVSWGAIAFSSRDIGAGWSQGKADQASARRRRP